MNEQRRYNVGIRGKDVVNGDIADHEVVVSIGDDFPWSEATFRQKVLNQLRQVGLWFSKVELKYIEWYDGD